MTKSHAPRPQREYESVLTGLSEESPPPEKWLSFPLLGWRILFTLLLLLGVVLLSLWWPSPQAGAALLEQSPGDPLVLAFYYTWFDENTWRPDKVPDMPLQPYVSRDRGVMGRHIDQAKRAGIDAFLVAWYGPWGDSNQTEPNLAALLEEAAARRFRIGILFETDSPFLSGPESAVPALQHALNVHASRPAYLRVGGKPVIFFWRPHIWSVETWRNIRAQVDPNHTSIWIAEGVDMAYQAVFDGHHLYSNTWNPPTDLDYTNQKFARWVQEARQRYGATKYWVATVMPGYDDTRTGRANAFARSREGGAYYERSWQSAIASQPDWIVITSFNEWPEGTYIEPSVAYGERFLDLTATWSQRFKAGGATGAALAMEAAQPAPTPTPIPAPDEPTALVQATLLNLRAGPGTDYPILAQIPAGTALPITGRAPAQPDWWQVRTEQAEGWVYGPLVQALGLLEEVAPVTAIPSPGEVIARQRRWANRPLLKVRVPLAERIPEPR